MQSFDTSTVKILANLSEDKVDTQQRSIERLQADPHGFVNRYRVEFKDHFNPDNAAELFSDYCSSPENRAKYRAAVGGAAGWVSDEAFKQRLGEPDETPVLFTAGGTASGKSTIAGPAADAGLIVFDSTFSNTALSKQRLQEALGSGRHVEVCYVYRDPGEAWSAGKTRTEEEGAGRTLTTQVHASTHEGAAKTVEQLTRDFFNNPQVEFRFFENSTADGLQVGGLELTRGTHQCCRGCFEENNAKHTNCNASETSAGTTRETESGATGGLCVPDSRGGGGPVSHEQESLLETVSTPRLPQPAVARPFGLYGPPLSKVEGGSSLEACRRLLDVQ